MKRFAERLNEAMRIRGIKQKDLVNKTGIAPGTISNYALGKYAPKDDKLQIIADALQVTVSYLCGYSDDPNPTGNPGLDSFLDTFNRMTLPGSFGPMTVSEEEAQILIAYRNADPAIQSAVRKLLDIEEEQETT